MSNYLAVATVTAALRGMLRPAVMADVSGADVSIGRPQAYTTTPSPAVNIFLYHSQPNPSLRNEWQPTRRADGSVMSKPRIPLQLDYLFTFYGDGGKLEPERLFAVTARTLNGVPQVSRSEIQDVVADAQGIHAVYPFLADTDLGDQVELVKLTQLPMSLEELSRLWALFPDIPYALSIAYQASVVVIEDDTAVTAALPVQTRDIRVAPIAWPLVSSVESVAGPGQPIVAGGTIVVSGQSLIGGAGARVTVGGTPLAPSVATAARLTVQLLPAASGPAAGPVGLRVTQLEAFGSPPAPRASLSSEPVTFMLSPQVLAAQLTGPTSVGPDGYAATISITDDIPVQPAQAVDLLLADPNSHQTLRVVNAVDRPGPTFNLDFPVTRLPGGTYELVLHVDGASSTPPHPTVTVP
jgi:Pvc16 N-terminal domain